MKGIKESFEEIRFTQEEQAELAQRLCRAAEQEGTMTEGTKRKVRKVSRGVVIGIAAALILTVGALAAAMNGTWGGLFSFQSLEEQELLEKLTYEIGQTKTVDGWEVILSRCAGDDRMLYIWVEMRAPKDFVYEPPEEYLDLYTEWDLETESGEGIYGSRTSKFTWDEQTRTITYCSGWPTHNSVVGETADIILKPLRWDGWNWETEEWVKCPLWEGNVVFEDVELNYPNETICLTPEIEIPYLDGTTTLTQLEISPFRAFARVEGGSCYQHHWVEATQADIQAGKTIRDGLRSAYGEMDCWGALEVEIHMKDGTVIVPRTAVLSKCQDGFQTEDGSYAGECYVERRMEYEPIPIYGMPDRVIDPSQVDYVTVCGVDIPVNGE